MRPLSGAMVLGLLLMSALFPLACGGSADAQLGTRSDGDRTVMLELFTATWCVGCPYADAAVDRLFRVLGPERLSVIQYHVSLTDPLRIAESDSRRLAYGDPALPSLFLDGNLKSTEANSYEEAYSEYLSFIEESLQASTPVDIDLDRHLGNGTVNVNASLTTTESLAGQNLSLRFVLFENILETGGKIYNYSARAYNETVIDPVTFPLIKSMTFDLDPSWVVDNMGAAVFLQIGEVGDIYQSSNMMFGEPPSIAVSNPPSGSISGEYTFQGTCTGGRGLSEAFIKIDNGNWEEIEGTTSWQHTVDTTELSDGSHTVSTRVFDIAGTYSTDETFTIIVKNEEPVPGAELLLVLAVVLSVAVVAALLRVKSKPPQS